MSLRRIVTKVVLGLAIVAVLAPAAWSASQQATTQQHKFHAHVDAYSRAHNCLFFDWDSPGAVCGGSSNNGNNGTANGFHGVVSIGWCPKSHHCYDRLVGHGLEMPHGYDRWMKLCRKSGTDACHNYLVGAVKMPNGPFAVVAGRVDGHKVMPSGTDPRKVEHQGGPLFLWVGYHGGIPTGLIIPTPQTGVSHTYYRGYVFGFRGWLNY